MKPIFLTRNVLPIANLLLLLAGKRETGTFERNVVLRQTVS